ncbi:unnamed protein product [Ambrosiozyma monospora]|uniref:Unnamed protein product n=1 Tax=Ambrosiozyma monospora TaxID=43982 RepID=A0ACB5TT23_AMBMO|nr:unnamed protein product [Ambrosiozyma monospora]
MSMKVRGGKQNIEDAYESMKAAHQIWKDVQKEGDSKQSGLSNNGAGDSKHTDQANDGRSAQESSGGKLALPLTVPATYRPSTSETAFTADITETTIEEKLPMAPVATIQEAGDDEHLATVEIWDWQAFIATFSPGLRFDTEDNSFKEVIVKSFSIEQIMKIKDCQEESTHIGAVVKRYRNEIESYEEIERHNASNPDDIVYTPKLIAYGVKTIDKGDGKHDELYFITLEKIEGHPLRTKTEVLDGLREVKLLKKIGIRHNNCHFGNYLHDGKNFYVIDYADAFFVMVRQLIGLVGLR